MFFGMMIEFLLNNFIKHRQQLNNFFLGALGLLLEVYSHSIDEDLFLEFSISKSHNTEIG
jgi:hypothetical protein